MLLQLAPTGGSAPLVGHGGPPGTTESSAAVNGTLSATLTAQVEVAWGRTSGGTNFAAWEHVQSLGTLSPGPFVANLAGLDTFRKYFFAFRATDESGSTWSSVASFRPQTQGILFGTGFEPTEWAPVVVGNLAGQGGWQVTEGTATVQSSVKAHGEQSVEMGQSACQVGYSNAQPVLWLDAFALEPGSTNQPMVAGNASAGAVWFSAASGILALDGDGQGNGFFTEVAPTFATNQFTRVSLRLDFASRRYDVWIDGVLKKSGLRFQNNALLSLHGLQRRASQGSYLDDVTVSTWGLDADSDGDGLVDLDEAKFYGSYPLRADSDGDGMTDAQELIAGTDPGDDQSLFRLRIEPDLPGSHRIQVPTVTGRSYTLQHRSPVTGVAWQDVPGLVNITGDGTEKSFVQPTSFTNHFYRGIVNQ